MRRMLAQRFLSVTCFLAWLLLGPAAWAQPPSLYLEDLTWMEVRDAINSGRYVAVVPTGGTEQNGPHMALGKHNRIVHYAAGEIARNLGNAMVAPVVAYVPEGRVEPPEGHMRFAGTVSLREDTFAALLEDIARSLKTHGFTVIAFLGDHGGNQRAQEVVAERLTREWQGEGVRVLHVSHYYSDANGQAEFLGKQGFSSTEAKAHAGVADTSELLAAYPSYVRQELRQAHTPLDLAKTGAGGNSTRASDAFGKALLTLKINAATSQIQTLSTNR